MYVQLFACQNICTIILESGSCAGHGHTVKRLSMGSVTFIFRLIPTVTAPSVTSTGSGPHPRGPDESSTVKERNKPSVKVGEGER